MPSTLSRPITTMVLFAVTAVRTAQSVSTALNSVANVVVVQTSLDVLAHTAALDTTASLTADVRCHCSVKTTSSRPSSSSPNHSIVKC